MFGTVLVDINGVAWTVVYIELIRRGFCERACGMPLFALTLNLAWEWIYGLDGLFGSRSFIPAQSIANLAWALCDVAVLATWLKFGRQYLPQWGQRLFVPYTCLALGFGLALQLAFYFNCGTVEQASIYSAFAQNAAMSAMFIDQLLRRPDIKAQSQSIAVAKWLGTLAPTIYGQLNDNPLGNYILIMGIVCCVFDLLYIALLRQRQRTLRRWADEEKA